MVRRTFPMRPIHQRVGRGLELILNRYRSTGPERFLGGDADGYCAGTVHNVRFRRCIVF